MTGRVAKRVLCTAASTASQIYQVQAHVVSFAFRGYTKRMLTWDEPKRRRNLKDHGLDFSDCESVFDGPIMTREDDRLAYGEQRINLLGLLAGQVVHMTYTERTEDLHVISLRKATKHEARCYFSQTER